MEPARQHRTARAAGPHPVRPRHAARHRHPLSPARTPALTALAGFIARTLLLLVAMAAIRSRRVLRGAVPANGLDPQSPRRSPCTQRLARTHARCAAGPPAFGGVLVTAMRANQACHGRAGQPAARCAGDPALHSPGRARGQVLARLAPLAGR